MTAEHQTPGAGDGQQGGPPQHAGGAQHAQTNSTHQTRLAFRLSVAHDRDVAVHYSSVEPCLSSLSPAATAGSFAFKIHGRREFEKPSHAPHTQVRELEHSLQRKAQTEDVVARVRIHTASRVFPLHRRWLSVWLSGGCVVVDDLFGSWRS
jgi:hypothetical protein